MQTSQINDFRNSSFNDGAKGVNNNAKIGIQNNFYTNQTSKPLKLREKDKNIIFDVYINIFDNFKIFIFAIIASIVILVSIIFGSDFSSIKQYVSAVISLSVISLALVFVIFFIIKHLPKYKRKLIFMDKSIHFKYKTGDKKIKYKEIRDVVKIKNLLSYSLYIYKIDNNYAYLEFDVDSLDDANSIEKLLINKIA